MIATSLRLRLILAFSALVSLIVFVGVVAYHINMQVRTNVAELRGSSTADVRNVPLDQVGLEIEGYWNPNGAFIATKITPEPLAQRPRLRGPIQAVSAADRTVTMYGVAVRVVDDTETDVKGVRLRFDDLQPGMRAELSCRVDADEHWIATKVQLKDVKPSDKVKGKVTRQHLDGVLPESVEMHGLRIVLEPHRDHSAASALSRIDQATQMLKALQECRSLAHDYVDAAHRADPGHANTDASAADASFAAGADLVRSAQRFEKVLADARAGADPQSAPTGDFLQYLDELGSRVRVLQHDVEELQRLRTAELGQARTFLDRTLEPFLESMLLFVYAYLDRGGEELRDELRGLQDRTETTTRVALGTSAVAVVVAVVLGLLVWRSIHQPIRRLHDAAVALGQGHLDTRIDIDSRDEIGVLADAFNRMAVDLASTTVSVSSLQGMFESMAAGVILCDQQGRITNLNRAAQTMVDRQREQLVGGPFAGICRCAPGETVPMTGARSRGSISVERTFVRGDGSELPVSLSVAEMRTQDGTLQGYVYVAQDLTPLKQVEAQLRESLGEKELLLREVHHRVKNNMQVISSLLAMQATGGDPEVLRRLEESQHRIRTIALIHEQLYESTEVARIDTRSYLDVLAAHLLQSFGRSDTVQLLQDVEPIELDLEQSLALGLIVNELLTNALKYAFPGGGRGTIRLSLREQPDGTRVLTVADDGCGMPAPRPGPSRTLGTSLIAKLARQLRGRVETEQSHGTTVRVVFPRSPAPASAPAPAPAAVTP